MTINELKEKMNKAQEAVAKTEKTIERHKAQAEKKLAVVLEHGWNPEDRFCRVDTDEHHDAYWAICEYQHKLEDIKSAEKKLEEKKRILQNWEERVANAEDKEEKFQKEIPDCMKLMMTQLVEQWDEYDINRWNFLRGEYRELGYKAYIKKHPKTYNFITYETPETIHKNNMKDAEGLVLNLYRRIHLITGEVTGWDYIHFSGGVLNGIVEGKLGTVKVESILAGGYNIQRLHVRVLVHEIK